MAVSAPRRTVAIVAPPLPGHLAPLQALGAELLAAGHRVTVVHTGGAARYVTDRRIGFAAIDEDAAGLELDRYLARLAMPTGPVGLTRMIAATGEMTARLLDRAPAVLRRIGADAVIADSAEPAGALIAEHLRLPHVVSVTGLPLLEEVGVPPPFLGWRYRPDRLGRFRNRGGYAVSDLLMRPIAGIVERQRLSWGLGDERAAPLAYVAQCPRALDYPRRALPAGFHYGGPWRGVPEPGPELPVGPEPLVFCSLGSLQGARRALFATMAAACAAVGARAVIGHGGGLTPDEEAALPGRPLVRAFWPQEAVLRHCAAAILHGGFNTVLDALAARVPIVAVPIAFEQPGTAARLVRAGAGRVVSRRLLSVRGLARVLDEVLRQPGYRSAAERLSAEMAEAGGAAAAAAIVDAAFARA